MLLDNLRWPYRENDRTRAEGEARCNIEIMTGGRSRIPGATIMGGGTGGPVATWAPAASRRVAIRAVAGILVLYTAPAEIGKWAAATYLRSSLTSSWVRRIIALLRRFG